MIAAHFIAYILLLHGWYAVPVPQPLQWEVIGDPPPCSAQSEPCPFAHVLPPIAVPQQSQQFDVPAVQQAPKAQRVLTGKDVCPSPPYPRLVPADCQRVAEKFNDDIRRWEKTLTNTITCEDTRRVLLTSEDGKHHCVLLEAVSQSMIPLSKCWGAADGLHCLSRECWDKPGNSNHEKNEACLKDWRAEFAEPHLACHYAYMQPVDAQGNPDGEQIAVRICMEEK